MTTGTATRQRWALVIMSLLAAVWLLTMLVLMLRFIGNGLSAWSVSYQDAGEAGTLQRQYQHQGTVIGQQLAAVAVGGAAVIAVVAFAGRLIGTGKVFVTLAVVLGVLALAVMTMFSRTDNPPRPDPPTPAVCQERSGGDTRCPGG